MNNIEFIFWVLSLLAAAILACQIAYASSLAGWLKTKLLLNSENLLYNRLSTYKTYSTLPNYLLPLKIILMMFGSIMLKLQELLACPYCLSFWIALGINYFYWQQTISFSIIYALIAVLFVEVNRKITL